ncbi:hypothetical protein EDD21DRAFT_444371 [Dissophora ornata]|nr:Ribose methyltransferase [Dissophora ornata]KAI8600617.1 hypothetical protein EDD21DRAFT_444371 [Dissophora ornata]
MATLSLAHIRVLRARLLFRTHSSPTTLLPPYSSRSQSRHSPGCLQHAQALFHRRPISTSRTVFNDLPGSSGSGSSNGAGSGASGGSTAESLSRPYIPTTTARVRKPVKPKLDSSTNAVVVVPKISKYRVDGNSPKVIKRSKTKPVREKGPTPEEVAIAKRAAEAKKTETKLQKLETAEGREELRAKKAELKAKRQEAKAKREEAKAMKAEAKAQKKALRKSKELAKEKVRGTDPLEKDRSTPEKVRSGSARKAGKAEKDNADSDPQLKVTKKKEQETDKADISKREAFVMEREGDSSGSEFKALGVNKQTPAALEAIVGYGTTASEGASGMQAFATSKGVSGAQPITTSSTASPSIGRPWLSRRSIVSPSASGISITDFLESRPEIHAEHSSHSTFDSTRQLIASSSESSSSYPSPFSPPTTIQRRPSQILPKISRTVTRTILDWSVHPTVQPDDFNITSEHQSTSVPSFSQSSPRYAAFSSSSSPSPTTAGSNNLTPTTSSYSDASYARAFSSKNNSSGDRPSERESTGQERPLRKRERSGLDSLDRQPVETAGREGGSVPFNPWKNSKHEVGMDSLEQRGSNKTASKSTDSARKIMFDSLEQDWKRASRASAAYAAKAASNVTLAAPVALPGFSKPTEPATPATAPTPQWKSSRRKIGFGSLDAELSNKKTASQPVRRMESWDDRAVSSFRSSVSNRSSTVNSGDTYNGSGASSAKSVSNISSTNSDSDIGSKSDPLRMAIAKKEHGIDYLYSPKAILPALKMKFRKVHTLYYDSEPLASSTNNAALNLFNRNHARNCIAAARDSEVEVVRTTRKELDNLAGTKAHGGVVLEASYLTLPVSAALGPVSENNEYELQVKGDRPNVEFNKSPSSSSSYPQEESPSSSEATVVSKEATTIVLQTQAPTPTSPVILSQKPGPPVWVVMEDVTDSRTMGDVVKTAMYLGIDGVLYKRGACSATDGVVSEASGGALETRPLYPVQSLVKFIQSSKENGWHIVGAHVTYGSPRNRPIYKWSAEGVEKPTLLVIGNNGQGLSRQITGKCDSYIQIPTLSRIQSRVDSLAGNVNAGVFMATLMAGRMKRFEEDPANAEHLKLMTEEQARRRGMIGEGKDDEEEGETRRRAEGKPVQRDERDRKDTRDMRGTGDRMGTRSWKDIRDREDTRDRKDTRDWKDTRDRRDDARDAVDKGKDSDQRDNGADSFDTHRRPQRKASSKLGW